MTFIKDKYIIFWFVTSGVFFIAFFLASYFPIYPDEIADKILWQRFLIAGGLKQSLAPECFEGFLVETPLFLRPAGFLWSLASSMPLGYFSYRLLPLILISFIFYFMIRNTKSILAGISLLGLTLGPASYALTILRPEIFFISAGLISYKIGSGNYNQRGFKFYCFVLLMMFMLSSVILFMHPKSIYMMPLILISSVFFTFRLNSLHAVKYPILLIFILIIVLTVLDAIALHKLQLLSCKKYPDLENIMNSQALNPLDAFDSFDKLFFIATKLLSTESFELLVNQVSIGKIRAGGAFPSADGNIVLNITNKLVIYLLLYYIYNIIVSSFTILKTSTASVILALFFCLGTVIPSFNSLVKTWYDCGYLISGISLTSALCSVEFQRKNNRIDQIFICSVLMLIILMSLLQNAVIYTAEFKRGYVGPSILNFSDQEQLRNLLDFDPEWKRVSSDEIVVADDLTYDLVSHHPSVIPVTYLGKSTIATEHMNDILNNYHVRHSLIGCRYEAFITESRLGHVIKEFSLTSGVKVCLIER